MRRILDKLYLFSGAAAASLIALICLLVSTQVVLNLLTKVLGTGASYSIPSYADFAGFFLASASFLALAYTFTRDGHIRVTLFLGRLSPTPRLVAEVFSLSVAVLVTLFTLWQMIVLAHESYLYEDVSPGMIAINLWIPQSVVCFGIGTLAIALIDALVLTLLNRAPSIHKEDML